MRLMILSLTLLIWDKPLPPFVYLVVLWALVCDLAEMFHHTKAE